MDLKTITSYLTFRLQNELFAISVNKVLEIIDTGEEHNITNLPKAPESISGVVNFRGKVIPVVDTRKKFDLTPYTDTDKYVIMVLNLSINGQDHYVGAMSDKVVDVVEINSEDIKPVPEIGKGYNSEFIVGVVHSNNEFTMLLNLEAALSSTDIINLKDTKISDETSVEEDDREIQSEL